MEEYPPAPQPQKENRGLTPRQTWLPFLEVGPPATLLPETPCVSRRAGARALRAGLFEIFFVVLTLVIFFGVMNYFNILPISQIWPNQLGFLPHRPPQTQNIYLKNHTSTILPTPIVSFEKTAKQLFSTFVSQNLQPAISPQLSSTTFIQNNPDNTSFDVTWQTEAGKASALFSISPSNPTRLTYIYLEIPFIADSKASLSVSLAKSEYPNFFSISPQGIWGCKPIQNITYCENFWEDRDGVKKGIQINGPVILPDNRRINTAFLCEFHKDSGSLYSHKSCLSDFAETGMQ